jgi:hypothetical protein
MGYLGKVLSDQLLGGRCIDRLSWHDLPGLSAKRTMWAVSFDSANAGAPSAS